MEIMALCMFMKVSTKVFDFGLFFVGAVCMVLVEAGCATSISQNPDGVILKFQRGFKSSQVISLAVCWGAVEIEPYYTPRGALRSAIVSEAGYEFSLPLDAIRGLEDIWPDKIAVASRTLGDYDVLCPYGVGTVSGRIFYIRNFKFSGWEPFVAEKGSRYEFGLETNNSLLRKISLTLIK